MLICASMLKVNPNMSFLLKKIKISLSAVVSECFFLRLMFCY